MIEYDPRIWHDTTFKKGFVYVMMFNEIRTINELSQIKARVIDRRIYTNRERRGNKWYWGWMAFEKPLNDYDAMCAGLVPIFKKRRDG